MQVRDVMSNEVTMVAPGTPLKDVARLLVEHGVSGMPVCGEGGVVLGVVSEADIVDAERPPAGGRRRSRPHPVTAGDAMTEPALVADPSMPIAVAAELMARRRVKRLPVVEHGRLVGIVSRADLVRAYARNDAEVRREIVEEVLADQLWIHPPAVSCSVSGGVATITGRLDRRSQVAIVEDYVQRVPGVVEVDTGRLTWAVDA
jgi:CBS domain-containing protein